jgi:hypothetical protein
MQWSEYRGKKIATTFRTSIMYEAQKNNPKIYQGSSFQIPPPSADFCKKEGGGGDLEGRGDLEGTSLM